MGSAHCLLPPSLLISISSFPVQVLYCLRSQLAKALGQGPERECPERECASQATPSQNSLTDHLYVLSFSHTRPALSLWSRPLAI